METAQAKTAKKAKYISKKVRFGSKEFTMWSIDGVTWSTRKEELMLIAERHEAERLKLMQGVAERVAEDKKERPVAAAAGESDELKSDEEGPVLVTSTSDDEAEDAPKAKAAKKKPVSARDRVQFVAPKPREIAKAKNKPAPNKKKRAA
jgi:hypothetical protein